MSEVYVATYDLESGNAENNYHVLLGVYSDAGKAIDACEALFDDAVEWVISDGWLVDFLAVGKVEIKKTAWAVERGYSRVKCLVRSTLFNEAQLRPLTKAEQERDIEALAEEYGRIVDEYESAAHE